MSDADDPILEPSGIDQLVAELRARVLQKTQEGTYPEGLSENLDGHFRHIVGHRRSADLGQLRDTLRMLADAGEFSQERIRFDSGAPAGKAIHQTVGKIVTRQTVGILLQVQEFADLTRVALNRVLDALEDPYGHGHTDIVGQLDAIWERLAAWERGPVDSGAALADVRRRLEALEAAEERRQFRPSFKSSDFEAAFRGSGPELKSRYTELADLFVDHGPVLDIGCGRGEFLELLTERGVECRGVEIDTDLVTEGRAAGFDIAAGDGVRHLACLPDNSLGGIVLVQVAEHLTPQALIDLVVSCRNKVRPGGLVVIETVNPQSLYTFAHSFYLDPTHSNPIHPAYLTFLFTQSGWSEVEILWRTPPPDTDSLIVDDESGPAAENTRRLNRLLFAPQDYALVARR